MSIVSRYLEPALIERLNALQLSARRVVEGTIAGRHKGPLKGASIEFRQHRLYAPGDDPRRLDWRVLGRTDRPYVKEYDEETNLRCALLLDTSGSMAYRGRSAPASKFDYAARLAAALAYLMLAGTESVGLGAVADKLDAWLPPHAGRAQLPRLIRTLENLWPRGRGDLARAAHELADRLGRRSLVVVVSDFFSPIEQVRAALAHLAHDRHETILVRVLDPDEPRFPFDAWSRFRGLEGEPARTLEPAVVRRTYLENFRAHADDLSRAARTAGAELVVFTTEMPLIDSLATFLRRHERSAGTPAR